MRLFPAVKSATTASVAGQYNPIPKPKHKFPKTTVEKLFAPAKIKEAIAETKAESNNVRRRPQTGESEKEPPKSRPKMPEI